MKSGNRDSWFLLALDLEGHKFFIVVLGIISFGFFVRQVGKQFFSQEVVDFRIPDQCNLMGN